MPDSIDQQQLEMIFRECCTQSGRCGFQPTSVRRDCISIALKHNSRFVDRLLCFIEVEEILPLLESRKSACRVEVICGVRLGICR